MLFSWFMALYSLAVCGLRSIRFLICQTYHVIAISQGSRLILNLRSAAAESKHNLAVSHELSTLKAVPGRIRQASSDVELGSVFTYGTGVSGLSTTSTAD